MNRLLPFLAAATIAAIVAPAARADGPTALSVGYDNRKMSRESCARKAVEAMGVKEKFAVSEVTDEGNAQGWNAKVAVQVLSFPMPDPERVYIVVIAAGTDGPEAERVQAAVRTHVFDGPDNPDTPKRIVTPQEKLPPRPVTLTYKSEERAITPVLRHFTPGATIALEKKGYQTKAGGMAVMGFLPDRGMVAFLAPTASAVSARLNVVYATPGEESGEKAAADVLSRIVKLLYE